MGIHVSPSTHSLISSGTRSLVCYRLLANDLPDPCALYCVLFRFWNPVESSGIQLSTAGACDYFFCPVGEHHSVTRTHKNHLLRPSPESSWFNSLSTYINKCINVLLHMHANAHTMLIANTYNL